MHDHLDTTADYTVEEFLMRAVTALDEASDRVRRLFGFGCTSAASTKERVQQIASGFEPHDRVRVLRMHPLLPPESP